MLAEQRLVGVLDVGCFSAHAVVVDPDGDSLLDPVLSRKFRLRLDVALGPSGRIDREGMHGVAAAVREARRAVDRVGGAAVVPFATSAIRDAVNADEVLDFVAKRTGVELRTFTGEEEAALSYLAARRWFGCSAGGLVVLDIGSGTVELAMGDGEVPSFTCSAPLGTRVLAARWGAGRRRPTGKQLRGSVAGLAEELAAAVPEDARPSGPTRAVACSKVFRQLARLAGANPRHDGPFVPHRLHAASVAEWIPRLAAMSPSRRAKLPGVSRHRAPQAPAGAVLAAALLRATGHESADLCPWSSREGLLLALARGLDHRSPTSGPRPLRPRSGSESD